jgi:hypothetical protein
LPYLRLPPKIKVLEAAGAIADARVTSLNDKWFTVRSSEGDREYSVFVDIEKREACSTDNGTRFRGYVGYPILSVLMLKGVLPYDESIGKALSGIDWKALNEKFKKYAIVEEEVKKIAKERGVAPEEIDRFKEVVYGRLKRFRLKSTDVCLHDE